MGSEMCIRDRYRGHPADLVAGRVTPWWAAGAVRPAWFRTKFERCLLYTSDAADDLLCVDLGGRRIIKKKKQTVT